MASTALERDHMLHCTDDHFRSHSNEPDHCLIRDNALDIIVIQPVVLSIDSHLGRASGLNNRQNELPTMALESQWSPNRVMFYGNGFISITT